MNAPREWSLLEIDIAVLAGSQEAEAAIEWFWRNGALTERHTEFIRHARTWCEQQGPRTVLERLRPPAPKRSANLFPSLMDWLALSSALGRHDEILFWFDERVASGDLPLPQMNRLRRAILERGRLEDWLAFDEPLHAAEERLRATETAHEYFADIPDALAHELEEIDCEVALWRRVAELARPDQLADVDAAIDDSERRSSIREWLARPSLELTQALMRHCLH